MDYDLRQRRQAAPAGPGWLNGAAESSSRRARPAPSRQPALILLACHTPGLPSAIASDVD